jgi:hypothetical protein
MCGRLGNNKNSSNVPPHLLSKSFIKIKHGINALGFRSLVVGPFVCSISFPL